MHVSRGKRIHDAVALSPNPRKGTRKGPAVDFYPSRTLGGALDTEASESFTRKPRYGFTQDWLRTNLADRKTSEKGNWWSDDSGGSEVESALPNGIGGYVSSNNSSLRSKRKSNIRKTPAISIPALQELEHNTAEPSFFHEKELATRHKPHPSDATLRQEDFYPISKPGSNIDAMSFNKLSSTFSDPVAEDSPKQEPNDHKNETVPPKPPLSRTASEAPTSTAIGTSSGLKSHESRPSISSTVSFQRPKKLVNWRGKRCVIALPIDIGSSVGEGSSKHMTLDEINARFSQWEKKGYDTRGFDLSENNSQNLTVPHGQSRDIYPDLYDWYQNSEQKVYRVSIPDKRAWDDYVTQLKEEKLRALGVSFGDEQTQSGRASVHPAMSRQASYQTSNLRTQISESSSSNASARQDFAEGVISRRLTLSVNQFSQPSSDSLPSVQQVVRPKSLHYSRQSVSYHADQGIRISPQPAYDQLSPGPGPQKQSFSSLPGSRRVSPGLGWYHSDPRTLVSQTSCFPKQKFGDNSKGESAQQYQSYPQSESRQGPLPSHKGQVQKVSSYTHDQIVNELTGRDPMPNRYVSQPDIASPMPLGHRNNLSETLRREVDDPNYRLEKSLQQDMEEDQIQSDSAKENEGQPMMIDLEELDLIKPSCKNGIDMNGVSDLDTNPSVANSPISIESPETRNRSIGAEDVKTSSVSKLNVNAQEFVYNPHKIPPPSMFAFLGNSPTTAVSMDSSAHHGSGSHVRDPSIDSTVHSSLNVAAPAFTPGAPPKMFIPSRQFSFSSSGPSLKPDAPSFKPNGVYPISKDVDGKSNPNKFSQGIFENIRFGDALKPTKESKAIPIVKPSERSRGNYRDSEGEEDESGRITQAEGRQKRIRRTDDDGDEVPQFAKPSQSPVYDAFKMQRSVEKDQFFDQPQAEEDISPLEKATDQLKEILDDLPPSDVSSLTADQGLIDTDDRPEEPFQFDGAANVALFNAARPRSSSPPTSEVSRHRHEDYVKMVNDIAVITSNSIAATSGHSIGNSLSALPQPSENCTDSRSDSALTSRDDVQVIESDQLRASFSQGHSLSDQSQLEASRDSIHSDADSLLRNAPFTRNENIIEVTYDEPSFEEIDTVIQQLNGEDSDIGVERIQLPQREQAPSRSGEVNQHLKGGGSDIFVERDQLPRKDKVSPRRLSSSREKVSDADQHLRASSQRRSIPSSSPNRLREPYQFLPERTYESVDSADVDFVAQNARSSPSFKPPRHTDAAIGSLDSPIHRLNNVEDARISDWDDAMWSADEHKLQSRSGFFDSRVHDLIGSIVKQRLSPLEKSLAAMNDSITRLSGRSASRRVRRSTSADIMNSDADDEDDETSIAKSSMKDRKFEKLKASIIENLSAQQQAPPTQDFSTVLQTIAELKESLQQQRPSSSEGIKTIVEEAVARQMRGKSAVITSSNQSATAEKYQLQITGLESMLKVAESRAEDEFRSRRTVEDSLAEHERLLRLAQAEAAEQRESAEETERSLRTFHDERQQATKRTAVLEVAQETLQNTVSELSEKNAALESTLEEYRLSSTQWREEIDEAKTENQNLDRTIHALKSELEDSIRGRHLLHGKFDRLQEDMAIAARDIARDQSAWRHKQEEQKARYELQNARLDAEARTRERLEIEIERLEAQEKEAIKSRFLANHVQGENDRLVTLVNELRSENETCRSEIARYKREMHDAKEKGRLDTEHVRSAMQIEVETAAHQTQIIRADLEAIISRLQSQLGSTTSDAAASKARYELMLEEASESRSDALREAADAREAALQEHYRFHERTLAEVKSQHELALTNLLEETRSETRRALEDRQLAESHLNARLALADEKVLYFQDKVNHLDEKLEIAKTAAQAAVQAVQTVRRTSSPFTGQASMLIARGSEIPGKISPQALRESIMALQEQLQEREGYVEKLSQELAKVDKDAPTKIKDRDIEINWLRELLGVRLDDLQDIISTLSRPSFDRDAVRDAAIRLKAGLEMEQQEKERAASGGQMFPSLSSISNLAASPRALPLAAAAAWGNWRKGQSSLGSLSEIANGSPKQTPSKASPATQGFLSGLLTPPSTNLRYTPTQPPSISTSNRVASSGHRPLRAYSTPRQSISGLGQNIPPPSQLPPTTPPLLRKASYDQDAESPHYSLARYAEDSESSVDGKGSFDGKEDEPFGPSTTARI